MGVVMNRAQRRKLLARLDPDERQVRQWADADDRRGVGPISDEILFKAHPDIEFRVRLASPSEVEVATILMGPPPEPEQFIWMAIRRGGDGHCQRVPFCAPLPSGSITDIPEQMAREIFEALESAWRVGRETA
jgi:hypothetical protein